MSWIMNSTSVYDHIYSNENVMGDKMIKLMKWMHKLILFVWIIEIITF